jgi:hypothetical protein
MRNDKTPLPILFNGLTVNSGYLSSYGFSAEAFGTVRVSASLSFWEKINGEFAPASSVELPADAVPLSVSDMSIDNGTIVLERVVENLTYSYEADVTPSFVVEENFDSSGATLAGVSSNHKRVSVSFGLYDYNLSLPVTGLRESFKLNFKDKNNNLKQSYAANGQLKSKELSIQAGERTKSSYSMAQASLGGGSPELVQYSPIQGDRGSTIAITAKNISSLDNIDGVFVGEYPCEVSGALDYTPANGNYTFNVIVSNDMLSGFKGAVRVVTQDGEDVGPVGFGGFLCTSGVTGF